MTATFQTVSHANAASGNTLTFTKPTSTTDRELLLVIVLCTNATATWNDDDATWTGPFATTARSASFLKITSTGEAASYGFTMSGGSGALRGSMRRWSGTDLVTPVQASAAQDLAIANGSSPTVTATLANSVLECVIINEGSNTSAVTVPAGMTQTFNITTTAFKAGASLGVGAGATGAKTWTNALSSTTFGSYIINSAPAPKTGTFTGAYDFTGGAFPGQAGEGQGQFAGAYDFTGSGFTGLAGEGQGTFTGNYNFTGTGFTGDAPVVPPTEGTFTGAYDFSGSNFVGIAGAPTAFGHFNGDYDFTGSGFTGVSGEGQGTFVGGYQFTGSGFIGAGGDADFLIDVTATEGGRKRWGGRK